MTIKTSRLNLTKAHGAAINIMGDINIAHICLDELDLFAYCMYIKQAMNNISRLREALITAGTEVEE